MTTVLASEDRPLRWFDSDYGTPEGYKDRGGEIVFVVVRPDKTEAHFHCAEKSRPICPGARIFGRSGKLGRRVCHNRCKQILGPSGMHPYFAWGCGDCIAYEQDQARVEHSRRRDDEDEI